MNDHQNDGDKWIHKERLFDSIRFGSVFLCVCVCEYMQFAQGWNAFHSFFLFLQRNECEKLLLSHMKYWVRFFFLLLAEKGNTNKNKYILFYFIQQNTFERQLCMACINFRQTYCVQAFLFAFFFLLLLHFLLYNSFASFLVSSFVGSSYVSMYMFDFVVVILVLLVQERTRKEIADILK